ncbi:serine O-acetyltransferase [Roseateles sp. YR242]|uniref:serine acetyltransferase n=1 Tax=Roseateles sp. YR242 TaxID=1855305 RepID=UPI0008BB58AD|nr:serine acetyltransferase [Roseateles sp. YR242]SEK52688.1 serine O-acetyltransferase [Roseateles sp. YR242]
MTQRHADTDWLADLARCGDARAWRREQSLWALWVYRFGRRVDAMPAGFGRQWRTKVYWLMFRAVETLTGISLPKDCRIGPGLRIWHFGGIFINPGTVIGAHCTLRQGVTLGNRVEDGPCPVLEDGVELGAYAQVIGGVRLGAGCRVGAMAVVLQDVPPGATAVGNPARILPLRAAGVHGGLDGTTPVPDLPARVVDTPAEGEPIKTSLTPVGD